MESITLIAKIRILFPRLLMGLVICSGYLSILHVLFVLPHRFLQWEEDIVLFFMPMVSALVWIFLMRNSFRYFDRVGRFSERLLASYSFFFLFFGNMMVQILVHHVAGETHAIDRSSAITYNPYYANYTITDWQFDTTQVTDVRSYTVTGKLDTDLNLHMTAIVPLVDRLHPKASEQHRLWVLITYSETIANAYDSERMKQKKLDQYCAKWLREVKTKRFHYASFHRLDRMYERQTFEKAAEGIRPTQKEHLILLEGVPQDDYGFWGEALISLVLYVLFFGGIGIVLLQSAHPIAPQLRQGIAFDDYCAALDRASGWIPALIPAYRYQLTPWLLIISSGLFIFRFAGGLHFGYFDYDELRNMGAILPESYSWRLLTAPLIESNVFSLLFQLLSWYYLGQLLEPVVPARKRLVLFISCTIFSGILHAAWSSGPCFTGAMGGTMAWFGMVLSLWYDKDWDYWDKKKYKITFRWMVAFFLTSLLCGILSDEEDFAAYIILFICGMFYTVIKKQTLLFPEVYAQATPSSE
ncbi:MAG: hypothetical protein RL607_78 [Bacteroidota bacterium]